MSQPTIEDEIRRDVKLGLIKPNLEPIKCKCGHKEFINTGYQYEAGYVSEYERRCKKCDSIVGYWAFGGWSV